jgi:hypothetical protein
MLTLRNFMSTPESLASSAATLGDSRLGHVDAGHYSSSYSSHRNMPSAASESSAAIDLSLSQVRVGR